MAKLQDNIGLITAVADALGPFVTDVVFVGGAVAPLLIDSHRLTDVRPTDDVDIIVEAVTYSKYSAFIEKLRSQGFTHVMDGPLCRFTVHGVTVDIMPTNEKILGFSNKWYPLAIKTAQPYVLPQNRTIQLINAPMFLCTKFEAFADRGKQDFPGSSDIEDIVSIVNGRDQLYQECLTMPIDVQRYLTDSFNLILDDEDFLNAMPGMLGYGSSEREDIVHSKIMQLATLTPSS